MHLDIHHKGLAEDGVGRGVACFSINNRCAYCIGGGGGGGVRREVRGGGR